MLKLQWYWKNGANGRQENAQKKSELLWPWPWKENKKNSLYICSAKSRKVFQSFCFLQKKFVVVLRDYPYRVIKLLLRFSICPGKIIFLVGFCISFMTCDELQGVQQWVPSWWRSTYINTEFTIARLIKCPTVG